MARPADVVRLPGRDLLPAGLNEGSRASGGGQANSLVPSPALVGRTKRLGTLVQPLLRFRISLRDDLNWATKIYLERVEVLEADQNVTYFFLQDYQEICRYMRAIAYGAKGKAESVESQVARARARTLLLASHYLYEEKNPRRISPSSFITISTLAYRAPA